MGVGCLLDFVGHFAVGIELLLGFAVRHFEGGLVGGLDGWMDGGFWGLDLGLVNGRFLVVIDWVRFVSLRFVCWALSCLWYCRLVTRCCCPLPRRKYRIGNGRWLLLFGDGGDIGSLRCFSGY